MSYRGVQPQWPWEKVETPLQAAWHGVGKVTPSGKHTGDDTSPAQLHCPAGKGVPDSLITAVQKHLQKQYRQLSLGGTLPTTAWV